MAGATIIAPRADAALGLATRDCRFRVDDGWLLCVVMVVVVVIAVALARYLILGFSQILIVSVFSFESFEFLVLANLGDKCRMMTSSYVKAMTCLSVPARRRRSDRSSRNANLTNT